MFSEYDYVITSRYHVALLSNTLSKKSLLINYDTHRHYINKNKYLYENYNFDKNIIDFSNIDDIKNNFEQLFDNSKTKQVDPKVFISAKKELNEMLNELESSLEKKHEKS